MLSRPLVRDDNEFDLVTLLQDFATFNLAHVEEHLLALINFVTQESKMT